MGQYAEEMVEQEMFGGPAWWTDDEPETPQQRHFWKAVRWRNEIFNEYVHKPVKQIFSEFLKANDFKSISKTKKRNNIRKMLFLYNRRQTVIKLIKASPNRS